MISPEAVEFNASFRTDIKESGLFTRPVDEQRSNWDEFGKSSRNIRPTSLSTR